MIWASLKPGDLYVSLDDLRFLHLPHPCEISPSDADPIPEGIFKLMFYQNNFQQSIICQWSF